ncbi:MAG: alpha/beta hydrolase [Kiritimatiellae bacterium]|nr:alpha/beta hydrolase [Kiritimatiellia bacterium]
MMIKKAFLSALRITAIVAVLAFAIGTFCLNFLMFHPVRGGYGEKTPGYVDIGTNGVKIAAIVLGPEHGKKAIIRCHGNAEDCVGTLWKLWELAGNGYTVAAVDYPGYGLSDGLPNEEGCYRNVHRLYDWLVEKRGFKPDDIIVDGFSIGTGPATELAATRPCDGLILEAPFLSAPRVVTRVRILPIDPFPNLKRIRNVKCRVLMIHGTGDRVVPFSQGQALFNLANEPKRFVSVEEGEHNSLPDDLGGETYIKLIRDFADNAGAEARTPNQVGAAGLSARQ